MDEIDEHTKNLVHEIRRRLDGRLDTSYDWDYNFIRWLNAYDNNVDQLLPILISTLEFRKALKLDKVIANDVGFRDTFDKTMQNYFPGNICGYDKRGNVLIIEPTGRGDPRGMLPLCRCSEFTKWRLFETEYVHQLIRSQEEKLHRKCGLIVVMDLEGFTMDKIYMPTVSIYMNLMSIIQRNYPDMLWKLLVIKSPTVVNVAYKLALPFLSIKNRGKIEFVSGDSWKSRLLELVDEPQLPVYWGGSGTGQFNEYGNVGMGGQVPEDIRNRTHDVKKPKNLVSINVGRRSVTKVKFQIKTSHSQIHWYFSCPDGDIEFGMDKIGADNIVKIILPHFRINTTYVPEYGVLNDLDIGDYEMVFDNSYSLIYSKTVKYSLDIRGV